MQFQILLGWNYRYVNRSCRGVGRESKLGMVKHSDALPELGARSVICYHDVRGSSGTTCYVPLRLRLRHLR
jgi:hypothetical protein